MTNRLLIRRLRTYALQADKRAKSNKHLESRLRAEGQAKAYWNALRWVLKETRRSF